MNDYTRYHYFLPIPRESNISYLMPLFSRILTNIFINTVSKCINFIFKPINLQRGLLFENLILAAFACI